MAVFFHESLLEVLVFYETQSQNRILEGLKYRVSQTTGLGTEARQPCAFIERSSSSSSLSKQKCLTLWCFQQVSTLGTSLEVRGGWENLSLSAWEGPDSCRRSWGPWKPIWQHLLLSGLWRWWPGMQNLLLCVVLCLHRLHKPNASLARRGKL